VVAAHYELLKKEVQRLWYQQRHQQHHWLPPLSPTGYDVQQQQLPPLSPICYELQQQQFSKLNLGSQQQNQQLSPLSPIGYELPRQRFSKLNLGSHQQQLLIPTSTFLNAILKNIISTCVVCSKVPVVNSYKGIETK
jgi:hypothetical protein